MPYADPAKQREYQRLWKRGRRLEAEELAGGECVKCGSTENLEFDHIDPETKDFQISRNLSRRWEVLIPEIEKCQLLCRPHHEAKTHKENYGPVV